MIPKRIQRFVERLDTQSTVEIEKKAKRLKYYSWFFLGLLLLMLIGYGTDLVSGKKSFTWNEMVVVTFPFLMLSVIMAASRDTLLTFLCMRNKNGSQPSARGDGIPPPQP